MCLVVEVMKNKKRKNILAKMAIAILGSFYFIALFAGFFSVYHYDDESREHAYAPPTKIHFYDSENKLLSLYVFRYETYFDDNYKRSYREIKTEKFPIRLFGRGYEYKLLGLFTTDIHLFTIDNRTRFYLLGSDSRGRDLFSRIVYGARVSLSIGLLGASIAFFLGLMIGGAAGYFGGRVDSLLMRLSEMFMLAPGFYMMLALRSALPPTLSSTQVYVLIIIIMSFIGWASVARIIRGMALSLREQDFVLMARIQGLSHFKIIGRHILPHTFSYAIVAIALSVPGYILGEAGLSFIGLGIQDPQASWGNLLSDAMNIIRIQLYPWILAPGVLIFITVICFNLLGEYLRDRYDVRQY